ncbi:hypothetical protein D5F01_LYC02260 [Larimichthys crocea]|uniref:PiggyBac transposable element-derived protein domain-containing protein n=1 Tax=Larimichthys crocea TaxID=215358 RepID=A0A6G0J8Q3_LARCR|nr:hypothetical protein D5F01_LYC02260 [Larimichthys crocea]
MDPMDHKSDASVTSESDTDTAEEDQEFLPGADSSDTSSTDSTDSGEADPPAPADESWRFRNGEIQWAPMNARTLQYQPTGNTPGPTCYAVSRVGELGQSFDLFCTMKMRNLVVRYTNLHGRRTIHGWTDLDATTIRAYIGLPSLGWHVQMIATYSCRRRTRRWPLVIFFNVVDISALNRYIIWKAINPT